MSGHCDTGPLWERVGYLSAGPWCGDTAAVLEVVRVVLRAIDEDMTSDVVWLHARIAAVLNGEDE